MGKSDWQPCKDLRLKSSPLKTTTPQNIEYMIYNVIHDMYNNICNVWEGQSGNLAQTWVLWKPSLQKMIYPSPKVIPTNSNVQQQQQQKPKPLLYSQLSVGSCRLDFICIFCSVTTWQRRTLALLIVHIMVRNRSNVSFISNWLEKFAETRCKVGHVGVLLPTGGFCWLIIDWRSCAILPQPACDRKSKRYFPQMLPFPRAPLDWDV